MNLVETLGVEIGVRTAGSDAAATAADAIAGALRELGLEPRFQEFQFLGYDPDEPELEIDGERWESGPCIYSQPTPPEGAEGRLRFLGLHVLLPPDSFKAPTFAIEDEDGTELARLYGNPVGGGAIPFGSGYGHILSGPAAYVSSADAERLRSMDGTRARLRAGGSFVPGRRDRNVLAELPGASDEAVLVGAHFDSVWRGPGTIDNATGVEGMRRVAERLAGRRHLRRVIFAAFAAEEIGMIGSKFFVTEAKLRGELERIVGVVNLDCIGHGRSLELLAAPDELRGRALEHARMLGLDGRYEVDPGSPGPGTDAYFFTVEKIPAISILHFPYPEYHRPEERLELVDEQRMSDSVDLAVALVESQLAHPVPHGRAA